MVVWAAKAALSSVGMIDLMFPLAGPAARDPLN
jgi:hypothetical protein